MRFLVGDVGGTKTDIAIFEVHLGKWEKIREERFLSYEYSGLDDILERFISQEHGNIDAACIAFAGPIEGGVGHATNLPWVADEKKLQKKFKLPYFVLLNDLVLHGYGIQTLKKGDFFLLNKGSGVIPYGNQALISAGTGLGESLIIKGEEPIHSEGGHCDFAPRDELEVDLFYYLKKKYGHVSYERVLSGPGLVNLYQFLVEGGHGKPHPEVVEEMRKEDIAKVITEYGVSQKCPLCLRTLHWFASLYGSEAGNFALKGMAVGGVFIGGGIAPKILPILKEGTFMMGFLNKGRFSHVLEKIPVKVILEKRSALLGSILFLEKKFTTG